MITWRHLLATEQSVNTISKLDFLVVNSMICEISMIYDVISAKGLVHSANLPAVIREI